MRKFFSLGEKWFTIASLLIYSGGPLTVVLSGGASEGDGSGGGNYDNSLILLIFLLNYFISFCLLVIRWKKAIYILKYDRYISILISLAVISIFWSIDPKLTIRRDIAIAGSTTFGLYLASRYNIKQQLKILGTMFGIAVMMSFIFGIVLRKYGIMGGIHAGTWRGIYPHKNVLGKVMVLSGILFLIMGVGAEKKGQLKYWTGLLGSVLLIILSTSTSSLINIIILVVAFLVYRTFRWRYDYLIPTIFALLTISYGSLIWVESNAHLLFNAIGKDATLTGRTDIWPLVLEKIAERPWLGYGFGAFWGKDFNAESAYIWYALQWRVPDSHSGLLDLWLELGLIGVIYYLLGFVWVVIKGLVRLRFSQGAENFWPLIYITYLVMSNLTESTLMIQNNIFWVIYVMIAFTIQVPRPKSCENSDNFSDKMRIE